MMKNKLGVAGIISGIFLISVIVVAIIFGINSIEKNRLEENAKERIVEVEDGKSLNASEQLLDTRKIDKIQVSDINISYQNGMTIFTALAENITNAKTEMMDVIIHILDERGNEIGKMEGRLPDLEPKGSVLISYSLDEELKLAYDVKIELHEEEPYVSPYQKEKEEIEKQLNESENF